MSEYPAAHKVTDSASRRQKARKIATVLGDVCPSLGDAICLEVGCAAGHISDELSRIFRLTVGVDTDRLLIEHAVSRGGLKARFAVADALALPFASETVDIVICAQVYEHVDDARTLLQEIRRVLKPGGHCFFSGPNRLWPMEDHYGLPFLHWLPVPWASRMLRLLRRGSDFSIAVLRKGQLRELMAGFDVIEMDTALLVNPERYLGSRLPVVRSFPTGLARLLANFTPNFNWILEKRH